MRMTLQKSSSMSLRPNSTAAMLWGWLGVSVEPISVLYLLSSFCLCVFQCVDGMHCFILVWFSI